MRWIGADSFLRSVLAYRALWVGGRFGGGKTLLSVAVSDWLQSQGAVARVVSNAPLSAREGWYGSLEYLGAVQSGKLPVLSESHERAAFLDAFYRRFGVAFPDALSSFLDDTGSGALLYDSAVIFDEAWTVASSVKGAQKQALTGMMAYLRKRNLVVMMPSAIPLHRVLSFFSVQRVFNFAGWSIPLYVYRWEVRLLSVRYHGLFGLCPTWVYPLYDTLGVPPPGSDKALVTLLTAGVGDIEEGNLSEVWERD